MHLGHNFTDSNGASNLSQATPISNYPETQPHPNFVRLEELIIDIWKKNDFFAASLADKSRKNYVFFDGPPFANGLPHYGHILTSYVKDTVARFQTMLGRVVERQFGWDCHGLPAEMAAEKELGVSGKKAIESFGVDKFNAHCQQSVLKYVGEWQHFIERAGRWVNFEGSYKTMDKTFMESVCWAFKQLYDQGLIYKSMRVMPYSWACETPVSDFETRMDNAFREKASKAATICFKVVENPSFTRFLSTINLTSSQQSPVASGQENSALPATPEFPRIANHQLAQAPCFFVAWTTTPWTLPSNLALAINSEVNYIMLHKDGKNFILAEKLLANYKKELGEQVICNFTGKELLGLNYSPLFPYFSEHQGAFRVLNGDAFVTDDSGTGIVHIAPGFGEDDQKLCDSEAIALVCPVDNAGRFTEQVSDFAGRMVLETNDDIIIYLKKRDLWIKTEQYLHNYPHCWRTDTPLIYKAVSSWYLKVTSIKERMVAHNQKINWLPEHIRDGQFGNWLENARDWAISRNRYWGCPLLVWESDDPRYPHREVFGSIAELEGAFGVRVTDLHKPFIDSLTKVNPADPEGKSKLVRVPEVLDCWFESGCMPFAQFHYPFANREVFEANFPADFVVEYIAQTRGWFYTLLVISTALFDRPPFLNCICHGVILGDDGQKLSKRLQNYVDPQVAFDRFGSDAMRWSMLSSQVTKGQELMIDRDGENFAASLRSIIKPLWSAFNFFSFYANSGHIEAEYKLDSAHILDRYIIAKLAITAEKVRYYLEKYEISAANKIIEEFIEILNNWYIRRSRERFWHSEDPLDKQAAFNTLFTILCIICRLAAPLLPFLTEYIYLSLTTKRNLGFSELFSGSIPSHCSVHLQKFPQKSEFYENLEITSIPNIELSNKQLITTMEGIRAACNAALFIRNEAGIKVRQPLPKVTFVGLGQMEITPELQKIILDEINVKNWENLPKSSIENYGKFKIQLNLPLIAKRLPREVQRLIAASKKETHWQLLSVADKSGSEAKQMLELDNLLLEPHEFSVKIEVKAEWKHAAAALSNNEAMVVLDLHIDENLQIEGIAREIIRNIQKNRKIIGLNVADRISLAIVTTSQLVKTAVEKAGEMIIKQSSLDHISASLVATNFSDEQALSSHIAAEFGIELGGIIARKAGEIELDDIEIPALVSDKNTLDTNKNKKSYFDMIFYE